MFVIICLCLWLCVFVCVWKGGAFDFVCLALPYVGDTGLSSTAQSNSSHKSSVKRYPVLAVYEVFCRCLFLGVRIQGNPAPNIDRRNQSVVIFRVASVSLLFVVRVPAGSPSRGGDVAVYVFDVNQPSLPTPFYPVLVSITVFMALSTVFHSINSPDNSPLSHSVPPVLILPYLSFQPYIS